MSQLPIQGTILGHPKGLFLLFGTEMWERFSYYGMRALLVLSLVAGVESANPGFGWTPMQANILYGWFTGLVYFTPIIGGWLADNYLGQRRSIIIGGILMAIGQFFLAYSIGQSELGFFIGLGFLVLGNGFFKPNISTMVGQLYPEGDVRRDNAFTIFYMGINTGALFAPLVCSTLGEDPMYGWSYGYLSAGVGMVLSVIIQLVFAKRYLGDIGVEPAAKKSLLASGGVKAPLTKEELDRLKVIFMIFTFIVLFFTSFEQAGGLMNLYASEKSDRFVGTFEVPAGWFQSLNPFFVVVLAPFFAVFWTWMRRHKREPSTPIKMVMGLVLTALGFVALAFAAIEQVSSPDGKSSMWWLVVAYLLHTMGELCISPVGLSLVSKLSPVRFASVMMGVWLLTSFFANVLAGYVGAMSGRFGELVIFSGIAITNILFAVVLWFLAGRLVEWMHGAEGPAPSLKEEVKVTAEHDGITENGR